MVEVIAFILKYLKDLLIEHLSRTVRPLKTTDFDWVITVPAIWDARGKRMMKEAAYLVSTISIASVELLSLPFIMVLSRATLLHATGKFCIKAQKLLRKTKY